MEEFNIVQFDLSKAKTPDNPNGFDVVTKNGRDVIILDTDYNYRLSIGYTNEEVSYPLLCKIFGKNGDNDQSAIYSDNGEFQIHEENDFDLRLKIPKKKRRMTNRELAWWLRDKLEEHREVKGLSENGSNAAYNCYNIVYDHYCYNDGDGDTLVKEGVLIRRNGEAWHEPLIDDDSAN